MMVPRIKEARSKGKTARIAYNTLFVDGSQFGPRTARGNSLQQTAQTQMRRRIMWHHLLLRIVFYYTIHTNHDYISRPNQQRKLATTSSVVLT
ncbi:hypothetical protein DPMN_014477 [Dreissena polymorpha]|uniref:Uncharacterized protein n=1 Tax=Dreissena polymorpha TaxID=45954 RepID=A0A9D4N9P6_DREPO|nr:hypothetical protein DPMN_014477 [Dreissena polymorpha]